jgi:hypothetical protein
MLNALDTLVSNGLSDDALDAVIEDLLEGNSIEDDDEKRCLVAVAWHREQGNKTGLTDCSVEYGDVIKVGGEEYRVLDEDDRDVAWEESLENYLDDGCIEGADGPYFDRAAWKKDARMDGAGGLLGGYDGVENEFCINNSEWWFLYRVN